MERTTANPLISVITVVYNRRADLLKTLQSVVRQTVSVVEYIVVDGGSTDGTLEVIRDNRSSIHQWVSESDKGIYDAMNKGVQMASGEWIIFMNAGDWFYDDSVLAFFHDALHQMNQFTIVYGDAQITEGSLSHIQHQHNRHRDVTKSIIHQSMFIRREFLLSNPYDLRYRIMADYENLLRLSVPSPEACKHVSRTVCTYDRTGVSSRPLYTYIREYYDVAHRRMVAADFIRFNAYILPRLLWSFRHLMK